MNPESLPDPWYCPSCDENREEKARAAYYDENVKSNLSGEFNIAYPFLVLFTMMFVREHISCMFSM